MTREEFKAQYVATFLASYMAQRYDDDCAAGHPNEPYKHQPVEDAKFCAEKALEEIDRLGLSNELFDKPTKE